MPEYLIPYIVYLISLVIFGVAFWKGDRPLKLAALLQFVSWTLSLTVHGEDKHILDYPITIIDTNTALALIWISMRWRRVWCAVLAALMILTVIVPFVQVFDRSLHLYNRYAANNVICWIQLVVMIVAIWLTMRARRRADEEAMQS